ncbi:MAG: RICIN domain-containing protein [Oscillospiraceae bacterium]|nr:RICIN domain-containing protein [Oscillospiraceae bacterium]
MFRKLSIPLAVILALGSVSVCNPGSRPAEALDLDQRACMLRNTATGKYLTVQNGGTDDTGVCAYSADGVADYNTWILIQEAPGVYTIQSGLANNLYLTTGETGGLVIAQKDDSNAFQKYTIEQQPDSDICRITAGGWIVAPVRDSDGAPVSMVSDEDFADSSEWEIIDLSYRGHVGDVNLDGKINIYDMQLAKMIAKDRKHADIMQASRADVNGDGEITSQDLNLIQEFILARSDNFPKKIVDLIPNTINPYVATILPPVDPDPDPDPTIEPPVTEPSSEPATEPTTEPSDPVEQITLADMPEQYKEPAEWIWQNRCVYENSTSRRNTIFDQIDAGKGTLNFVVRWQSYKTITYEQRQKFQKMASKAVNDWNDYLKGYDGWKYDHIDVKIVGWAVLDKSCLLDLHDDEIVYDNLISDYDSQYDTSNGYEAIPDKLPSAPSELSRFDHFAEPGYEYPGGLDKRFDMYIWATQGFPAIGGAGGDWGQRLSDDAYINMLDGTNIHVLEHEIGHGFGITDFYGENGTNSGPPPAGFPDNGTSIMMAGSSMNITPFDGWLLRYMWSQIKDEDGRFSK